MGGLHAWFHSTAPAELILSRELGRAPRRCARLGPVSGPISEEPRFAVEGTRGAELPPGVAQAIVQAAERAGIGVEIAVADRTESAPDLRGETASAGGARPQVLRPSFRPMTADDRHSHPGDGRTPVRIGVARARVSGADSLVRVQVPLTQRSIEERALLATEQRFLRLIEGARDGIVIIQVASRRVVYANRAAVRGAGYSSLEEFLAGPAREYVHPDDRDAFRAGLTGLLEGRQSSHSQELRLVRRDGGHIAQDTVTVLAEWDGERSMVTVGRDLSARRRFQAQLVQADRLAAAGTLAAGVAHEINNPLAYVLLNLQYLLRELPRVGSDRQRLEQLLARLREANHGARRVSTIVHDLRDFSEPEPQQLGPVDLRRVLGAALKIASSQLEGRARVLEEYEPVPPVHGSAARLEQVFLNLLINAGHALAPERAEQNQIRVGIRPEGGSKVVVEIADNGAGISSDLLGRVFDPFFTTKPAGMGTGLGLPICHSIVSGLGGVITADSQPGRGTVFRVTLPTSSRMVVPRAATPFPFAVPNAAKVRVLVVDDELPVAAMLSKLLADECQVRITTSGREALELMLGPDPFDVVLCDLLMPGMSGMDLHRQLAEQRPGLEDRFVFMTGGAFTPRAGEFLARIGNQRIEKPFDLNEVRRMVRKVGAHG
jgi:PAS domain S-box-containing protein